MLKNNDPIPNNTLNQLIEKIKTSQPQEAKKMIESMNFEKLFTESTKEELIQLYELILAVDTKYTENIWQEIQKFKKIVESKNLAELPKFVINTIAYVPDRADTMDGDSSDEEYEGDKDFLGYTRETSKFTSGFPFRTYKIETKKVKGRDETKYSQEVGSLIKEEIKLQKKESYPVSNVVKPFLDKLLEGGFEEHESDKLDYLVSVSIGLNRPKSLSSRKNKPLEDELNSNTNDVPIRHEKFATYWQYKWYDKDNKPVDYKTVKTFYKQLKKYDKDNNKQISEEFRKQNEEANTIVPYQDLRECVAKHVKTKFLVQKFREESQSPIYFSFIDVDTIDFNGIYSAYLRIVQKQSAQKIIPIVMSTGYEFRGNGEDYPYQVGSQLDRAIRVETAKHLPLGVYYPEPNFCVLLPHNRDTLCENFTADKDLKKLGNAESAALLRQIFTYNPDGVYIFSNDNPLITTIPDRTRLNLKTKSTSRKEFSIGFKEGGQPNDSDITTLKFNQSHFDEQNWVNNLYINRSFQFNSEKVYNEQGKCMTTWNEFFVGPAKNFLKGEFSEANLISLFRKVGSSIFIKIVAAAEGVKKIRDQFEKTGIIQSEIDVKPIPDDEITTILKIAIKLDAKLIIKLISEKYNKFMYHQQKLGLHSLLVDDTPSVDQISEPIIEKSAEIVIGQGEILQRIKEIQETIKIQNEVFTREEALKQQNQQLIIEIETLKQTVKTLNEASTNQANKIHLALSHMHEAFEVLNLLGHSDSEYVQE